MSTLKRKKHPHTLMSTRRCAHIYNEDTSTQVRCTRMLKQNLIDKNPDALLCFGHWKAKERLRRLNSNSI